MAGHRTQPHDFRRDGAAGYPLCADVLAVDRSEDPAVDTARGPRRQGRVLAHGRRPMNPPDLRFVAPDVTLGRNVKLAPFINLYGCDIGDDTKIGPFVEI